MYNYLYILESTSGLLLEWSFVIEEYAARPHIGHVDRVCNNHLSLYIYIKIIKYNILNILILYFNFKLLFLYWKLIITYTVLMEIMFTW